MMRAENVANAARSLRTLGYVPDIVIGHHGWGELLNLQDVWPESPLLGYFEYFYNETGFDVGFDPEFLEPREGWSRIRAKNAVNLLALTNPGHGFTPTKFQHSTYPAWARRKITVLPEGVNLDVCRPNPALHDRLVTLGGYKIRPGDKLVTYVVRDLEPYRGFHIMMRALPRIPRRPPGCARHPGRRRPCQLRRPPFRWHLARKDAERTGIAPRYESRALHRAGAIRHLRKNPAAVRYPCVSDLSVRGELVVARSDGERLRRGRQRYGHGARVHNARQNRAAGAVPGAGRSRRQRAAAASRMRG